MLHCTHGLHALERQTTHTGRKSNDMDTLQIRNFLMIVECGSITKAADRLGIAQPSLSQQLLRIEDELGVSLFKRTARGVTPTEAGRLFQEHALNILQAMQRAREQVNRREDVPRRRGFLWHAKLCEPAIGRTLLVASSCAFPDTTRIRESVWWGALRAGWSKVRSTWRSCMMLRSLNTLRSNI